MEKILLACMFLAVLIGVAWVGYARKMENRPRSAGRRHGRRPAQGPLKNWMRAMLEAFLKMFREPDTPPAAPELTVQRATNAVHSDPDMQGIPADARPRITTINELLASIDRRIGQDLLGQPLVIEMEQMRDRHLPKLLRSYVEIPSDHRREIFNKTGKSASVHLAESLDAMVSRLKEIDRSLASENLDTFEDNARFIARTYGRGTDPLS